MRFGRSLGLFDDQQRVLVPTRAWLLELVKGIKLEDSHIVQLSIPMKSRPQRHDGRVRLCVRFGPLSAEGRTVIWSHGVATAWWTVGDLRRALELRDPTRAELAQFVEDLRDAADTLPSNESLGVYTRDLMGEFDHQLSIWGPHAR
jgi:hypothetical protein